MLLLLFSQNPLKVGANCRFWTCRSVLLQVSSRTEEEETAASETFLPAAPCLLTWLLKRNKVSPDDQTSVWVRTEHRTSGSSHSGLCFRGNWCQWTGSRSNWTGLLRRRRSGVGARSQPEGVLRPQGRAGGPGGTRLGSGWVSEAEPVPSDGSVLLLRLWSRRKWI